MEETNEVEFIKKYLNLKNEILHPDFYCFKFEDIKDVDIKIHEPYFKTFFEIGIFRKDAGTIRLGVNSYTDLSNSVNFIAPGQLFSYRADDDDDDGVGFSILFKAPFINTSKQDFHILNEFPYFKTLTNPTLKLLPKQFDELFKLFEDVHVESNVNDLNSLGIIRSIILLILHKLNRIVKSSLDNTNLSRSEMIAYRFENLVIKHAHDRIQIAEFAEMMNISTIYLTECVKKTTGKTSKQIMIDYQILAAKSLLSQTDKSINEVAFELGFDETTNFTKFFKKYSNQTPKQFRKFIM